MTSLKIQKKKKRVKIERQYLREKEKEREQENKNFIKEQKNKIKLKIDPQTHTIPDERIPFGCMNEWINFQTHTHTQLNKEFGKQFFFCLN